MRKMAEIYASLTCAIGFCANAQIKTSVDSTSIKIGEELIISFKVETDSLKNSAAGAGLTDND